MYTVVVKNKGKVYSGDSRIDAEAVFDRYVTDSEVRGGGEVYLYDGEDLARDYTPHVVAELENAVGLKRNPLTDKQFRDLKSEATRPGKKPTLKRNGWFGFGESKPKKLMPNFCPNNPSPVTRNSLNQKVIFCKKHNSWELVEDAPDVVKNQSSTTSIKHNPYHHEISKVIAKAFLAGQSKKIDNTETDGTSITLHGSKIVSKRANGIYITTAGHVTKTTKERLNAFADVVVKRGELYCNGELWDGNWKKIAEIGGKKTPELTQNPYKHRVTSRNLQLGESERHGDAEIYIDNGVYIVTAKGKGCVYSGKSLAEARKSATQHKDSNKLYSIDATLLSNPLKKMLRNPPNDASSFSNTAFQQAQSNPKRKKLNKIKL